MRSLKLTTRGGPALAGVPNRLGRANKISYLTIDIDIYCGIVCSHKAINYENFWVFKTFFRLSFT